KTMKHTRFSYLCGVMRPALMLMTVLLFSGMATLVLAETGAGSAQARIAPVGEVRLQGQPPVEIAPAAAKAAEEQAELEAAPQPGRADYPNVGMSSRAIVWMLAQMHLFFGALVLAVPLFVLMIELVGVYTGDERYDDMAHEFMKISLTGFSITAIFGGSLALALFMLYPDFMGYMMHVFGAQVLVYASMFFFESFFLYVYYYG
ncbi:cytochrome ubiquinol oxidase subunit I, partial [Thiolapillus sp.]|uniref:cytochrome ubiquinol oxidase subunit I n=5 Tax=Thiolapillus sp. TaxID=2017437 RepID=UPI0025DF8A9E